MRDEYNYNYTIIHCVSDTLLKIGIIEEQLLTTNSFSTKVAKMKHTNMGKTTKNLSEDSTKGKDPLHN